MAIIKKNSNLVKNHYILPTCVLWLIMLNYEVCKNINFPHPLSATGTTPLHFVHDL